jgi:hypothetical protein
MQTNLLMLYFALLRSKLDFASVTWNCVTITGSNKHEHIQWKFEALCHNRILQDIQYHSDPFLEKLNLQIVHIRCHHFDALFLINVLMVLNIDHLSLKQSVFMLLLGTYITLLCLVAPLAPALQLDVFLLLMQLVNLQILL